MLAHGIWKVPLELWMLKKQEELFDVG